MWPKELTIYVHNEKYDSAVEEWLEEQDLTFESPLGRKLVYIANEVELTYSINEDGSYKMTHVNGRKVE